MTSGLDPTTSKYLAGFVADLRKHGKIIDIKTVEPSLEEIFLKLMIRKNFNMPQTLIISTSIPSKSASFPVTRVALRWFAVAAANASPSGML
ncbi:hypothetical protein ig2599ANME_1999 [groundwater metagenome]